jgi:hypothetical protein
MADLPLIGRRSAAPVGVDGGQPYRGLKVETIGMTAWTFSICTLITPFAGFGSMTLTHLSLEMIQVVAQHIVDLSKELGHLLKSPERVKTLILHLRERSE